MGHRCKYSTTYKYIETFCLQRQRRARRSSSSLQHMYMGSKSKALDTNKIHEFTKKNAEESGCNKRRSEAERYLDASAEGERGFERGTERGMIEGSVGGISEIGWEGAILGAYGEGRVEGFVWTLRGRDTLRRGCGDGG